MTFDIQKVRGLNPLWHHNVLQKKICSGRHLTPELRNSNWTGARRRTTVRRRFFGCAVQLFKNGFQGLIVGQIQDGSGPERPACVPGLVCSTLRGLLDVRFTCDRVFFLFCQSENHLRTPSDWESVQRSSSWTRLTEDVGIRTRGGAEMSHRSHMFCHCTRCDLLQTLCALYNFPAWNSLNGRFHCTCADRCRSQHGRPQTAMSHDDVTALSLWVFVTDLQLCFLVLCFFFFFSSVCFRDTFTAVWTSTWVLRHHDAVSSPVLIGRSVLWVLSSCGASALRLSLDPSAPSPPELSADDTTCALKKRCSLRRVWSEAAAQGAESLMDHVSNLSRKCSLSYIWAAVLQKIIKNEKWWKSFLRLCSGTSLGWNCPKVVNE